MFRRCAPTFALTQVSGKVFNWGNARVSAATTDGHQTTTTTTPQQYSTSTGSTSRHRAAHMNRGGVGDGNDDEHQHEQFTAQFRALIPPKVSPEEYFFGNSKTCRLCGELCLDSEQHLTSLGHQLNEILVDLLLPIARRGEDPKQVAVKRWPHYLHDAPHAHTIRELTDLNDMDRRVRRFQKVLVFLKTQGIGLASLMDATKERPVEGSRSSTFERLECIGDHSWGSNVASRIMQIFPQVDWRRDGKLLPCFHILRDTIETNASLENVYGVLGLDSVVSSGVKGISTKFRGDVLECLLGELQVATWSTSTTFSGTDTTNYVDIGSTHGDMQKLTLNSIVHHALHDLYDIVVLSTFYRRIDIVLEIVKELAVVAADREMKALFVPGVRKCPPAIVETRGLTHPNKQRLYVFLPRGLALHDVPTPFVPHHQPLDCPAAVNVDGGDDDINQEEAQPEVFLQEEDVTDVGIIDDEEEERKEGKEEEEGTPQQHSIMPGQERDACLLEDVLPKRKIHRSQTAHWGVSFCALEAQMLYGGGYWRDGPVAAAAGCVPHLVPTRAPTEPELPGRQQLNELSVLPRLITKRCPS